MDITEMKSKVQDKILDLMIKFEDEVQGQTKHKIVLPDVKFTLTGCAAGTSTFYGDETVGVLNFNSVLMEENWEVFIETTVPHEVAHYCSDIYVGTQFTRNKRIISHGSMWKSMMRFFGVKEIKRCHSYRLDNVKQVRKTKRFLYVCEGGHEHQISTVIHNRINKGEVRVCSKCKTDITFVKRIR
jgi:predicted SprT family Zn-dependent metalloprotease